MVGVGGSAFLAFLYLHEGGLSSAESPSLDASSLEEKMVCNSSVGSKYFSSYFLELDIQFPGSIIILVVIIVE